ncbi:MAG: DUF697 domain-containing protein [Candidatus Omnitrophota bacterium]|jgi:hypothetical protein|nr:MAG: DUF697 domain-containing protein [Candidatus Omnitrophota bacterium]
MKKQIKIVFLSASALILFLFFIFVINQTVAIVQLSNALNQAFGKFVLFILLTIYTGLLITPFIIFLKMPKVLKPPDDENSPDYDKFAKKILIRLSKNTHLKDTNLKLQNPSDIDEANKVLDAKANDIIQSTAATVFVTTAVSQYGHLDAILVLIAQTRLIWQVAHIYNQRPALNELVQLYANVAVTTFLATQIEDIDISDQIQPVLTSVVGGSVLSSVPGVSTAAHLITNSIVHGSANAFLTLRVGIITRKYFTSMKHLNRGAIKRFATVEATSMLGPLVMRSAKFVSDAILQASKKTIGSAVDAIKNTSKHSSEFVYESTKKSVESLGHAAKISTDAMKDVTKKSIHAVSDVSSRTAQTVIEGVKKVVKKTTEGEEKA